MAHYKRQVIFITFVLTLFVANACSNLKEPRQSKSPLDTPEYHTFRGNQAIKKNDCNLANDHYAKALELKPDYTLALAGKAVAVSCSNDALRSSSNDKSERFISSQALLEMAFDYKGEDKREEAEIHIAAMQVYFNLKFPENDWSDKVKEHFEEVLAIEPANPKSYYFMAKTESVLFNYEPAKAYFIKVMDLDKEYAGEASRSMEIIHQIERALPSSKFGKQVAFFAKITKADLAALLVAEIKLNKLCHGCRQTAKIEYEIPDQKKTIDSKKRKQPPYIIDINNHPLQSAIREVLSANLKGLEVDASRRFHPDKELTRAEYALIIQELLIRINRDHTLASRYIGSHSPYPDVKPDVWYYNASRVAVDRGFMKVKDNKTGRFGPMQSVSGAEALLMIHTFKDILRKYQL